MVFITRKRIKGRVYYYLEKSIRLPDGKITKISKVVSSFKKNELTKYAGLFLSKEKNLFKTFAMKNYGFHHPLDEQEVGKIESIRVDYKRIIHKLKQNGNFKDLLDRFTVNFTYESNAIEGNSLTLKDVAIVLFESLSIPGKDLREIYETRNSRPIVDMLMKKRIKITHNDIIKIHSLLMKDIDEEKGYKKLPNYILGSKLKTSPPERVHEDMDKLINWYHENETRIHPLELAASFHGRFLQIHPFKDGNGRVARFLLNAQLVNKDYPPIIIRKSQRVSYLRSLHAFDNGSSIQLVRLLLEKFKKTYQGFFETYVKYI